jgi:hypothetical protein
MPEETKSYILLKSVTSNISYNSALLFEICGYNGLPGALIYIEVAGFVRFKVLMAVTINNAVFLDVTPCGSCENRHFEGMYRLHH